MRRRNLPERRHCEGGALPMAALILAVVAVYLAIVSLTYSKSAVHSRRAAECYQDGNVREGDAERERGRKLRKRADKMLTLGLKGGS